MNYDNINLPDTQPPSAMPDGPALRLGGIITAVVLAAWAATTHLPGVIA